MSEALEIIDPPKRRMNPNSLKNLDRFPKGVSANPGGFPKGPML